MKTSKKKLSTIYKSQPVTLKAALFAGLFTIIGVLISTLIPILISGKSDSKIELVDVSFVEEKVFPGLDFKIRNTGDKVAFLKRVNFQVLKMWEIERDFVPLSYETPSKTYDVVLPLGGVPYSLSKEISHSIQPNGVDRFVVNLGYLGDLDTDFIFLVKVELFYDEKNNSVTSQNLLFATNRFDDYSNIHPGNNPNELGLNFSKKNVIRNKEIIEEINKSEGLKSERLKKLTKEISEISIEN